MAAEDLEAVWTATLSLLQDRVPRPTFETHLRRSRPVGLYGSVMVVGVPNAFAKDFIEERFAEDIRLAVQHLLQREVTLEFVAAEAGPSPGVPAAASAAEAPAAERPLAPDLRRPPRPALNPKYTFDTFVIGGGNRLAHAAALAVAEAPGRAYNPLFLYGGVGLGKTHLLHAIAHAVLSHFPSARVVYVGTETFATELIDSIRDGRTVEFKNRYRNVDVLLVDDIQFLAGKESFQEEFFHTFNALYESGRQIVLSSDRPPRDLRTLEERLRSRFEWGLISDIQPPDLETRIAILSKKAQLDRIPVPEEVLYFIAERVDTNIRELEGAFVRLVAHASFYRRRIDLDLAHEALKELLPPRRARTVTVRLIQEVVAEHYGLDPRDMVVRRRTQQIAFPRQVAMYLARELTDLSLPRIGQEFGGRDHTTVLHAHEKIANQLASDPELRQVVDFLRRKIGG